MKQTNLRNWALFFSGERIDGAHEYTGPDMSVIVSDIRTGGMDTSLPFDDGMEAMKASFKIYGVDPTVLAWFGFQAGQTARVTVREAYVERGPAAPAERVDTLEGLITKLTPDAHGNSNQAEAAITAEMSLSYYKSVYAGQTLFEIDPPRFIRIVNGVNVLDKIAQILRAG